MIDAEDFDKLEEVARIVRNKKYPFGGMTVVLCGDFAQLPPVKPKGGFAKDAKCWNNVIKRQNMFQFTKVIRQADTRLVEALCEIRMGIGKTLRFFLLKKSINL